MDPLLLAELAAVVATVLAAVGALPQIRRLRVTGDLAGLSLSAWAIAVATESVWAAYSLAEGLWGAVPEAVLMTVTNSTVAVAAVAAGAPRRALLAGVCWAAVLSAVALVGGAAALGTVLGGAFLVQAIPAVWAVYRTARPSGVSSTTWAVVGVEAVLWSVYGLAHGDRATITFGVVALPAALAILARKAMTARRPAPAAVAG